MRSQDYANLSKDAYKEYPSGLSATGGPRVLLGGVAFYVRQHVNNPATGYQGTIYQRVDTGELVVAHRGTEFDREPLKDGVLTDAGMVLTRANVQAGDAVALTAKALEMAKSPEFAARYGIEQLPVSITGHSLGGTLAQVTAHHFGLRGETFNAYGAASLGLRIPEGGHDVINHVMAGDAVSAASPHYGQVRVYARPEEIRTLLANGYDNERHWSDALRGYTPIHLATGMTPPRTTAAAIGMGDSHRMHHFVDVDAKGQPDRSVLGDPSSLRLAGQNATAIAEYRAGVRTMRATVTVVARGIYGALQDGVDAWRGPLEPGEPARQMEARLSPVSQRLLGDSREHVQSLSQRHGLSWDQGMENTACAVARCARENGMDGISHLRVADGQITLAQWDGVRLDEASIDALQAANTPAEQSLRGLQMCDARSQEQAPVPQQEPQTVIGALSR